MPWGVILLAFCLLPFVASADRNEVQFTIGALLSSTEAMQRFNESIRDVRAHVNGKKITFLPITEVGKLT